MGVPLCGDEIMDCHITSVIVWVCAFLLILIAIVQAIKADPEARRLPRRDEGGWDGREDINGKSSD
jgi:hypothetical protein